MPEVTDEIRHPTYGTLDELLATIARDVRQGYDLRIGLQGALNWFIHQYGKQRAADLNKAE